MADAVLLFIAAVIVLGACVFAVLVTCSLLPPWRAARKLRESPGEQGRRLRRELSDIDDYIRRLGQAGSEEELQRLEQERKPEQ